MKNSLNLKAMEWLLIFEMLNIPYQETMEVQR